MLSLTQLYPLLIQKKRVKEMKKTLKLEISLKGLKDPLIKEIEIIDDIKQQNMLKYGLKKWRK